MRKTRRFDVGGSTFSPEQEKWLGGADRTDPYILARMRRAVPDSPAPVEDRKGTPVGASRDETPDKSYDTLESKRLSTPASKPDETPDKSYGALESKRLSSPTPAPKADKEGEDAMAVAASKVARAPAAKAPAAKAPAAKPATKAPARTPVAEAKTQRARLDVPNAAGPRSAANPMSRDQSQRSSSGDAKRSSSDETKLSLSDRMKLSRERSKSSSTGTDTRPVGQRIRESLGMKKGGQVKKYAKGGGIEQRGKTRGKIC